MEVYQSSKTAAEMEFALGAVPSIGANGNWFIGDQDTGIYAKGLQVSTAEEGQTVIVKAVDENGKPTEWESADFPMGDDWELIADITIEEEVTQVHISTDINGEPFQLRRSYVSVKTEATASNTANAAAKMRVGINNARNEMGMSIPNAFRANNGNGFQATFESNGMAHYGIANASAGMVHGFAPTRDYPDISVDPQWCGYFRIYGGTFAVGSRIIIMGVRV